MNLPIGTLLQGGRYKIEKVLGQGTFGITYQAEMKVQGKLGPLDFPIAIKEFFMKEKNERRSDGSVTCSQSSADTCEYYRKKFRHEAENLSKMRHGNIVKVNDVFDENNTSYYVMELVAGGSLDSYINERHGLPEGEALRILREAGSAISYMHSKRMLHLDIKPNNIMRRYDGHIFLIDFGLSKQYKKNGEPETSTNIGWGTPPYAPHEQSSYKPDGSFPATLDVHALGATLYKMLVGSTPPYPSEIIDYGFNRYPLEQKGVSIATISVIEKAMASKKADRYQTVAEMLSALPVIKSKEKEEEPEVIDISEEDTPEDVITGPLHGSKEASRLREKANELFDKGSYEKAFELFLFSADLDEKNAEDNRIGWLYFNGKGTEQDYKKAFEWWLKSANKGNNSSGQYNLGMCYEHGHGCKKDLKKAKEWYRKAMRQGDKDAKAAYERLNVRKESSLNIKGAVILSVFLLISQFVVVPYLIFAYFAWSLDYVFDDALSDGSVLFISPVCLILIIVVFWLRKKGKNLFYINLCCLLVYVLIISLLYFRCLDGYDVPLATTSSFAICLVWILATLFYKKCNINGHEYVDLGLSVKWATCNIWASSPTKYGEYYAWGENSIKSEYTEENSETYGKNMGDIAGNSAYDAARANWGGSWRLPTKEEFQELLDNCKSEWTTQSGVKGRRFTSKKNGKSIFLPAAGWRNGSSLNLAGEYGYYSSSTPYESNTDRAYSLWFHDSLQYVDWSGRNGGHSVRPVSE